MCFALPFQKGWHTHELAGRYVCFALPFQKGWHTVRSLSGMCASPYLFRKDGTLLAHSAHTRHCHFIVCSPLPFLATLYRVQTPPCIGCDMIWLFSVGGAKASGLCDRSVNRTAHLSRPDSQGHGRIRLRATCQRAIHRPHLQTGCAASGILFVVHSCRR